MNVLVVISMSVPKGDAGYSIAIRSSLEVYQHHYDIVYAIAIQEEKNIGYDPISGNLITEVINYKLESTKSRFIKSLFSVMPAICMQFRNSNIQQEFKNKFINIISRHKEDEIFLVVEGLAPYVLINDVVKKIIKLPVAFRSHDVLYNAFKEFGSVGHIYERMAWKLELMKIRKYEKYAVHNSDAVWAITSEDIQEYNKLFRKEVDGEIGIYIDVDMFNDTQVGDPKTILHLGAADYRKSYGIELLVKKVWPKVLQRVPDANLLIGGKNTEKYHNPGKNIVATGFVSDEIEFLSKGSIFVNPQVIGSGIKLKSIVAMAANKTLVSTENGIKGIKKIEGKVLKCQDDEELHENLIHALENYEQSRKIANQGKNLVETFYCKEALIRNTNETISSFINKYNKLM